MSKKYTRFRRKKRKDKRKGKGLFSIRFFSRAKIGDTPFTNLMGESADKPEKSASNSEKSARPLTLQESYQKQRDAKTTLSKLRSHIRGETRSNRQYNGKSDDVNRITRAVMKSITELAREERAKINAVAALERKEFREAKKAVREAKRKAERTSIIGGTRKRSRIGGTRKRRRT